MVSLKNQEISTVSILRLFWQHLRHYKALFFCAVLATVASSVLEVIVPLYYKDIFNALALGAANKPLVLHPIFLAFFAIIALLIAEWFTRRLRDAAIFRYTLRVMSDLTETGFKALANHSYSFFVNNFSGSLVKKVTRLPHAFRQLSDELILSVLPLIVTISGILFVLFLRHAFLGWVFTVWILLVVFFQISSARSKNSYRIDASVKDSQTVAVLSDSIGNDITIKLFSGQEYEETNIKKVVSEQEHARGKVWFFHEKTVTIQSAIGVIAEIALLYSAITLWQKGLITVGDFVLIQAYVMTAINRLWALNSMLRNFYDSLADAHEMIEIIELPVEVTDKKEAKNLFVSGGIIHFENVQFSFQKNQDVLNDFSLTIRGGEKVALVGPSGAGKSTIVKLLLRFYDRTDGSIKIDGQDIAEVTQASLRNEIAFVPQEPLLFHRTLLDNIRYGKRDATDEEVIRAAKLAHCHEFVEKFPEKYKTFVGERGVKLSGGERQRVAIARAILKNAPILVLDEATSSLDSESELFIQDALAILMQGKTVIVIAHRLSTIMKMDRIVVLENGKISALGTHEELIGEPGGLYKKLWEIQAGGFLSE